MTRIQKPDVKLIVALLTEKIIMTMQAAIMGTVFWKLSREETSLRSVQLVGLIGGGRVSIPHQGERRAPRREGGGGRSRQDEVAEEKVPPIFTRYLKKTWSQKA